MYIAGPSTALALEDSKMGPKAPHRPIGQEWHHSIHSMRGVTKVLVECRIFDQRPVLNSPFQSKLDKGAESYVKWWTYLL